ncbi:hypothetical protein [Roseibium salinum]|uniref:Uncharacterized protein n=1 Tax=Roseibium salinum TaxID=1604349 RepID=A0ABT3R5Q2_9HYPH|nr:hypothetical protein [Roseibium sp. DSM 29163]MCX2724575.1 hypothetical protein [Roseibium sp. DSM 29163]
MYIITMTGMALYGGIALLFVILSTSDLVECGRSNTARLWGMVACSFFWPVTLLVVSLLALLAQYRDPASRPARQLWSHLPHHWH